MAKFSNEFIKEFLYYLDPGDLPVNYYIGGIKWDNALKNTCFLFKEYKELLNYFHLNYYDTCKYNKSLATQAEEYREQQGRSFQKRT